MVWCILKKIKSRAHGFSILPASCHLSFCCWCYGGSDFDHHMHAKPHMKSLRLVNFFFCCNLFIPHETKLHLNHFYVKIIVIEVSLLCWETKKNLFDCLLLYFLRNIVLWSLTDWGKKYFWHRNDLTNALLCVWLGNFLGWNFFITLLY